MDRSYTFRFLCNKDDLTNERVNFVEMYERFHRLAIANRQVITAHIGKGWHTSATKVMDNAIVGFVKPELD